MLSHVLTTISLITATILAQFMGQSGSLQSTIIDTGYMSSRTYLQYWGPGPRVWRLPRELPLKGANFYVQGLSKFHVTLHTDITTYVQ